MLQPRETISLDDGEPNIQTVDEILEEYEIKGLTLEELQEKYVNDSDSDYERYLELEEKYETLNSNINDLQEEISTLTENIEELQYNVNFNKDISTNSSSSFVFIIVILILVIVYLIKKEK